MGRYHATVESRHSATETSGYLATFSDAAEWDPECSPGSSWIPGRRPRQLLPARPGRPVSAAARVHHR
jgi:hypothetical protein